MSNFFVLGLTLLGIGNGIGVMARLAPRLTAAERLCFGAAAGLAGLSWIGFIFSLALGLNGISIGLTAAVLLMGMIWHGRLSLPSPSREWRWGGVYYLGWALLFAWIFGRVIDLNADGLFTSPANNFGDLGFHLSVITSLAYGENLPPQNPIFAGMTFTYPFLIDFLTAFFLRCGAGWRTAFFVENIVLAMALVGTVEILTRRLFGRRPGELLAGRLAPVIFVFSGGLGFLKFWSDLVRFLADQEQVKKGLIWFLANLPATYSINNELSLFGAAIPLRYGNLLTTMLIPQRSMLFGLPIVGMIVVLWRLALTAEERETQRREMLLAGLLAGLLPMLHAHGFFATMMAAVPLTLIFWTREWAAFYLPAALLAGPQAYWLSQTQVRSVLFKPHLWWEAGQANPLLFWLANNGIFLLALLAVFVILIRRNWSAAKFYLPFWLWFAVPNAVLLAPWPWDNIKVLVYWSLVSSPLVALAPAFLWRRGWRAAQAGGLVLLLGLILTGLIDVGRGLSPAEKMHIFTREDWEIAARIRDTTPPRSVILHASIHNSPVALSGRRSLMGYPGHLWSHGIEYGEREDDIKRIFALGSEATELLARYQVDYVMIGPVEASQFQPNLAGFGSRYPVVFDYAGTRLFRIK